MSDQSFDPSKYLTKIGPADYLPVMWRLVWLRDMHPDAVIETELISRGDQEAVFRARVTIPGGGSATGYGSETFKDFRDYIEKAETKAIGRALAALGFGTQFSAHEFGGEAEAGRIVDSPVGAQNGARTTQPPRPTPPPANGNGRPAIQNPNAPVSAGQANYIRGLAKQLGMEVMGPDGEMHTDEGQLVFKVQSEYDATWPDVTMGKASEIIEGFKAQLQRAARS